MTEVTLHRIWEYNPMCQVAPVIQHVVVSLDPEPSLSEIKQVMKYQRERISQACTVRNIIFQKLSFLLGIQVQPHDRRKAAPSSGLRVWDFGFSV